MVMVLEDSMVKEIAAIGENRRPSEACGILLPHPINGRQIFEMPNRSATPHDEVIMSGEDVILTLEMVFGKNHLFPDDFPQQLTFWHTHPGGNLGPSSYDLQNSKSHSGKNLVVTLGDEPKATWF